MGRRQTGWQKASARLLPPRSNCRRLLALWVSDRWRHHAPIAKQQQDRQARRRLAILRHAEEISGNVAQTCRYYGINRTRFYVWQRRYQEEGLAGLWARPSRS
ncbi:helix-turn-helix domain-containing protein [Micromonospora chersina]|uniref:helix-turn-helix domain-containing protein n=1 Tax=Micromonospora chersina TaxID=47854 RepID=UPI0037198824